MCDAGETHCPEGTRSPGECEALGVCGILGAHGVLVECEVQGVWGILWECKVLEVWGILGRQGVLCDAGETQRPGGTRGPGGIGESSEGPGCPLRVPGRGGVAALPRVTLSLLPAGGAGAAGAAAVPPGHGHVPVRHRAVRHRARRLVPRVPRRQRRGEHGDLPEPPVHRDLRAQPQRLPSASVLRGWGGASPARSQMYPSPRFLAVASQCRVPLLARCAVNSVQWYWFLSYLSQGF